MPNVILLIALSGFGVIALGTIAMLRLARARQRSLLLEALHRLADEQEAALRALRQQLASANDDISALTDRPATRRGEAAFAAAMREQLEHRLWLRDRAVQAPMDELHQAREEWRGALDHLVRDAATLRSAHRELAAASQTEAPRTP